jgi:hypothetical protein
MALIKKYCFYFPYATYEKSAIDSSPTGFENVKRNPNRVIFVIIGEVTITLGLVKVPLTTPRARLYPTLGCPTQKLFVVIDCISKHSLGNGVSNMTST